MSTPFFARHLATLPSSFRHAFQGKLDDMKRSKIYRYYYNVQRIAGESPYLLWHRPDNTTKKVISFCSLDYLGLSQHPEIIAALQKSVAQHGVGSGGSRAIGGNSTSIVRLEQKLAEFHHTEAARVFTSGYVANTGAISVLASTVEKPIFLSDEENHASIIQGMKIERTNKIIFKHNDMHQLEKLLIESRQQGLNPIIILESVYSMSGSIAPLKIAAELAKKYQALLYVDEVHAIGLYGPSGRGIAAREGVTPHILLGTLSKSFGVQGGYIACDKLTCDLLRTASSFIFTTSLPPSISDAVSTGIDVITKMDSERAHLLRLSHILQQKLEVNGINFKPSESHIIPIVIGDAEKCRKISDILINSFDCYAQPIVPPTVRQNEAQLRIALNVKHNLEHVDQLVRALTKTFEMIDTPQLQQTSVRP